MEEKKKQIVYVNPNFTLRKQNNTNPNVTLSNRGMHINPNFQGSLNLVPQTNLAYNIQSSNTHNIHLNPKLLQIAGGHSSDTFTSVNNTETKSTYIVHSRNKFVKKCNVSESRNTVSDSLPTSKTPLLVNQVIKKPSYSLVRKDTKKQLHVENITTNSKSNRVNSNKALPIKSSSNVWNKKSESKSSTCSTYSLRKRKSLSNNLSLQKSSLHCPIKNRSLMSLNKTPLNKSIDENKKILGTSALKNVSQCVYIGGSKYFVKNNLLQKAKETKQKMQSKSKQIKRVNLCGITYIRKSDNIFVMDNRLKNSIKKRKKINVTCPIFRRLGICKNFNKNKCPLLHDPRNISICQKFLKGICYDEGCHLSHDVVKEKMPTCKFFLEGCCTKESCPYLHVKVNESADICQKFLNGYCELGDNCNNKHLIVCPNFYKYSKCDKARCTYPHKVLPKNKELQLPDDYSQAICPRVHHHNPKDPTETSYPINEDVAKSSRYFNGNDNGEKNNLDNEVTYKGRTKLGDLPSYISL